VKLFKIVDFISPFPCNTTKYELLANLGAQVKNTVQPEFQSFHLSRPFVLARNAPFYGQNKKKESRNRAKVVIIFYDPGSINSIKKQSHC